MPVRFDRRETLVLVWTLLKGGLLGSWVGLLAGTASWIFLASLDWATRTREQNPSLLFALPLAGAAIAALYDRFGKSVSGGNNLLLERIHEPNQAVPFRMASLILITTVMTHLFGGSAGREGTAVQMGGTLGQLAVGPLRLGDSDRRLLIMAGIAGGFGSVFGTPLAGTIFAMEVLAIGRIGYDALIPCLAASVVGDSFARALGTTHHNYMAEVGPITPLPASSYGWVLVAGVAFAAAAAAFSELTHLVQHLATKLSRRTWLRAAYGGLIVIGLTFLAGNQRYNGLGLPLIEQSFHHALPSYDFAAKLLFTAVTLGFGFKGGEVTPLFCIGATLGNAFAVMTHQPIAVFAAIGFVAVFAGAANTPLACTVMGMELFGAQWGVPFALTCVTSYVLSGHRGIYLSQRVRYAKTDHLNSPPFATLRDLRENPGQIRLPRTVQRFRNRRSRK